MIAKIGTKNSASDVAKWIFAILLTCAGLFANYHFQQVAWPLRLAGWILLAIAILALALTTVRGRQFVAFAKDSRMELRKVDWPSRQETIQFTIGVIIMVLIMALALWLIDTALLWIVKWFTG
jgi:preprotein translocase subunit SecE